MGINRQGIHGNWKGKVGNIVGRIRSGRTILSIYQPDVSNPQTTAQQSVRLRFKMVSQLMSTLLAFIRVGFAAFKDYGSAYSAAIKDNFANILGGIYPNFTYDWASVLVSKGTVDNAYNIGGGIVGTDLELTWTDTSGIGNALATDQLMVIALNDNDMSAVANTELAARSARSVSFGLPSAWSGAKVQVWAAMRRADGTECSNSAYLGEFTVE